MESEEVRRLHESLGEIYEKFLISLKRHKAQPTESNLSLREFYSAKLLIIKRELVTQRATESSEVTI